MARTNYDIIRRDILSVNPQETQLSICAPFAVEGICLPEGIRLAYVMGYDPYDRAYTAGGSNTIALLDALKHQGYISYSQHILHINRREEYLRLFDMLKRPKIAGFIFVEEIGELSHVFGISGPPTDDAMVQIVDALNPYQDEIQLLEAMQRGQYDNPPLQYNCIQIIKGSGFKGYHTK